MKFWIVPVLLAASSQALPDVHTVLETLDQLYRSDDSHSEMAMRIVTHHWDRTLEMEAWSLGSDKTFILIHSPVREAGTATLRLGTEMWNYLPNTGSTVRIPPSMMTGSWMGSDLTNNDMVKEITYADDYSAEYMISPSGSEPVLEELYLKLTPKPGTAVVWAYIECAVLEDPLVPVWEKYYDSSGELIKTITFSEVREMDGRTIPTVMVIQPSEGNDQSTTISWTSAEFNRGVDEAVFTLDNLQNAWSR